jgi:hypothetical protein
MKCADVADEGRRAGVDGVSEQQWLAENILTLMDTPSRMCGIDVVVQRMKWEDEVVPTFISK